MNKKFGVVALVLVVAIAFGGGYYFSTKKDAKPATQDTSSPSTNGTSKQLDVSGQQLTALPSDVTNQTTVTALNISNNQLTTLPPDIAKMTKLQVLNVENNRLESLPAEIGQMSSLRDLDLSNNRLMNLPAELGNLTNLQTLNLDGYKGPQSDIDQLKAKLPNTNIKT